MTPGLLVQVQKSQKDASGSPCTATTSSAKRRKYGKQPEVGGQRERGEQADQAGPSTAATAAPATLKQPVGAAQLWQLLGGSQPGQAQQQAPQGTAQPLLQGGSAAPPLEQLQPAPLEQLLPLAPHAWRAPGLLQHPFQQLQHQRPLQPLAGPGCAQSEPELPLAWSWAQSDPAPPSLPLPLHVLPQLPASPFTGFQASQQSLPVTSEGLGGHEGFDPDLLAEEDLLTLVEDLSSDVLMAEIEGQQQPSQPQPQQQQQQMGAHTVPGSSAAATALDLLPAQGKELLLSLFPRCWHEHGVQAAAEHTAQPARCCLAGLHQPLELLQVMLQDFSPEGLLDLKLPQDPKTSACLWLDWGRYPITLCVPCRNQIKPCWCLNNGSHKVSS